MKRNFLFDMLKKKRKREKGKKGKREKGKKGKRENRTPFFSFVNPR